MSTSPSIVGLTLNYRDPNRTRRCVYSLLDDGARHVVVWDNSGDGGASAAGLAASLCDEPRVSVEISPVNLGFAAGVNQGLEWCTTRFPNTWVLLINNDACLRHGALNQLRTALLTQVQAVVAYPNIDHSGHVLGTVFYQRHTGLLTQKPLPGSFPYASGCCLLIAPERASTQLFDEDFFMYGDDWALGWKLGASKMAHVSQTLVVHEGSASSGLGSPFYETRIVAAHWLLASKLTRFSCERPVLFLGHALALTGRALARTLRFRSSVPLHALLEGWRLAHGNDPQMHEARAFRRYAP